MRRLILRAEAEIDIASAFNHALLFSARRSQNLLEAVDEGLRLIEEQPRLYAVRSEGVRRMNLSGVPFALIFRFYEAGEFEGTTDEIVAVIGLIHQAQDLVRFVSRLEKP